MAPMATWEDGPEYAPIQRPEGFTVPEVPPLSVAPPVAHPAAGAPVVRPQFAGPGQPVAALESLVPRVTDQRDPAVPFAVVTSAVTAADSAWGAAHWSKPDGGWGPPGAMAPVAYDPTSPVAQHYPPAPTSGFPAVAGGPLPSTQVAPYGAPSPSGFPAPGSTEWFAPPPSAMARPVAQADAATVLKSVTPAVLITLVLGGLIALLAPLTLLVAFALATRIKVAQSAVRKVFLAGLGVLAFFALVGALTNGDSFGDWWEFVGLWALLISWVVGVVVIAVVYRALKNPDQNSGGYQQPWA